MNSVKNRDLDLLLSVQKTIVRDEKLSSAQGHKVGGFPGRIVVWVYITGVKTENVEFQIYLTHSLEQDFTIYNQTSGSIHTDYRYLYFRLRIPRSVTETVTVYAVL